MKLDIATFNIGTPSATRAKHIVDYLFQSDIDSILLVDIRDSKGTTYILDSLSKYNYVVEVKKPKGRERGLIFASKFRFNLNNSHVVGDCLDSRIMDLTLFIDNISFSILGLYVPNRSSEKKSIERKQRFLEKLSSRYLKSFDILLGDFNIIGREHIPTTKRFRVWEYDFYYKLSQFHIDSSLKENKKFVHTWFNSRGVSYTYDYIFLKKRKFIINNLEIDKNTIALGLSDHALLRTTLDFQIENKI